MTHDHLRPIIELADAIEAAEPITGLLPAPADRRAAREAAHITQEQAATALGVPTVSLARWECGGAQPRHLADRRYRRLLSVLARMAAAA